MFVIAVASFASGTVVRVLAANNNLWVDEVFTLQLLSERVHSFSEVFTNLRYDNNHHLCSLWMWLVGQNASPLVYRLPSILGSIGTIVLAGLIGLRQSRLVAYIAVILTSWSYLLVHYGTEARGYSLVIFFALLAWYALQQFEDRGDERGRCVRSSPLQAATTAGRLPNCVNAELRARSWIWIAIFWGAVVLGFLSHLEFAICFAGLIAWALWRCVRYRSSWRRAVLDLIALFTVPMTLMLIFYFVSIRGMKILGQFGYYRAASLLIKTGSYTLGGPGSGAAAGIIALLAVAALGVALIYCKYDRDDRWIFYVVVIIVPLAAIAIDRPAQLHLRYLMVLRYLMISVAMSLLLFSSACAATLRRGVPAFAIGVAVLALYVTGNAANTVKLLRFGRGQYLAALVFIETHSNDKKVLVTSNADLGIGSLVNYYKRYLYRPEDLQYVNQTTLREDYARTNGFSLGAEWLILFRDDLTEKPPRMTDEYGNRYQLVTIYRGSDLSGSNWLLYHNLNRPGVAPQSPLLR